MNVERIPDRNDDQLRADKLFHEAMENRRSSCFWDESDWEDRWELQGLYSLPTTGMQEGDRYKSNIKSPEISGRIQSAMHKLSRMNVSFVVRPKNSAAKLAARVDELVINHFFDQQNYRTVLRDAFYTGITNGSSPIGVEWVKKTREVQQVISDPDLMDAKQKKKVKKGEMVYSKVEMIDVAAPVLIDYPLKSIYLDPNARKMQGSVHNCGHAFYAELITWEDYKANFLDKPGFKDTDLVRPVSKDFVSPAGESASSDMFLHPPIDSDGDYVYIVKFWDYYRDEYKVKANEVYIKESPLPYADKKIPVEMLKPYTLPHQIYGVGMVDLLIPSVYQLELIQNAFYDWLMYTTNPILLVQRGDYGDFSRKYKVVDGKPGALLPVSSVRDSVDTLKFPSIGIDVFQGIGLLQKDATLASQHDPNQLGSIQKDTTATANLINKEIAEAFVNFIADNFTSGLENIAGMVISRIHEFMAQPDISKIVNGELEDGQPFEVAIPGKYVDIDWDERTVKIEDNPERVSVVKISKDLYEYRNEDTGEVVQVTPNDYEITLSAESKEIISKALEQQRLRDSMDIMMSYAVDPNDSEKSAMHPLPLFNATEIADQFLHVMGLSPKLALNRSENEKADIRKAQEQNEEMFEGNRAMPKAGESGTHVRMHVEFQQMLINGMENLKSDIESTIRAGGAPSEEQREQFDKIQVALPLISEHIDFDTTNVTQEAFLMSAVGKMMGGPDMEGQEPPPEGGMGPDTGMGQSMTQSGMGGDSALPNMPQDMGMTQGGAGPLTKM